MPLEKKVANCRWPFQISCLFLFVALQVSGCTHNLNKPLSQAESGCTLLLIGDRHTLRYKGVTGARGIYAHCGFEESDRVRIESYTVRISRAGIPRKKYFIAGELFSSEVHQFFKESVQPGDRIDFTEVIAFRNDTKVLFDAFWLIVE